jgi:hypothetical protein
MPFPDEGYFLKQTPKLWDQGNSQTGSIKTGAFVNNF